MQKRTAARQAALARARAALARMWARLRARKQVLPNPTILTGVGAPTTPSGAALAGVAIVGTVFLSAAALFGTSPTLTGTMVMNGDAAVATTQTVSVDSNVSGATAMRIGPPISQVSLGNGQALALTDEGTLWVWGSNYSSELGTMTASTTLNDFTPTSVATNWASVSAGVAHSAALKADGTLFVWGDNGYGEIGNNSGVNATSPVQIGANGAWSSVSAGGWCTYAIKKDGTLWGWGYDANGSLGDNGSSNRATPVQISVGTTWTAVSAGNGHSLGIRGDGSLWSWGGSWPGDGSTNIRTTPVFIDAGPWKAVSAGAVDSYAIKSDGSLWAWGANSYGEDGVGDTNQHLTPVHVAPGQTFSEVSAGAASYNVAAIRTDGTLWTWGYNWNGQLGLGDTNERHVPTQVGSATNWSKVSSNSSAMAAFRDGVLYTWGAGQLGDWTQSRYVPASVDTTWTAYSASTPWSLGAQEGTHTLWAWYRDGSGGTVGLSDSIYLNLSVPTGTMQLNAGESATATRSVLVQSSVTNAIDMRVNGGTWQPYASSVTTMLPSGDGTKTVTVDYRDGFARTLTLSYSILLDTTAPSGALLLNKGAASTRFRSVLVESSVSTDVVSMRPVTYSTWTTMTLGGDNLLGQRADGSVWGSGSNAGGDLGDGTTMSRTSFVQMPMQGGIPWRQISAGGQYTLAIRNDGTLWAWGWNYNGQLGDGTTVAKSSPVQIGSATDWSRVVAGYQSSFAFKNDGSMYAWGYNSYGELGIGNQTNPITTPTRVGIATDYWKDVSTGQLHTIAIKSDGTLWGWGYNYNGQVGDGTTTQRNAPVKASSATNWKSVTVGSSCSQALTTTGRRFGWGANYQGQLGDGTTTPRTTPTTMGPDTDWKSLVTGSGGAVLALKNDGSLWSWGYNYYGQLGDYTLTDHWSPVRVGTRNDWKQILVGDSTAAGLTNDGTLWVWGWNQGRFGDATQVNSTHPVKGDWLALPFPSTVQLAGGDGAKSVGYVFRDLADNETTISATITLDSTLPTGSVVANGGATYATSGNVTVANSVPWATQMRLYAPTVAMSAGDQTTVLLGADGVLQGAGINYYGAMGTLNVGGSAVGMQSFGGSRGWTSVSTGDFHTMLLRADGSLWTMGYNVYGQLGNGTTSGGQTSQPQHVGVTNDWAYVSAGFGDSLAIKSDGSLWGWGLDGTGQIGDGTYTMNQPNPIKVGTGFKQVSAAAGPYSMAIKNNGTLWGWGNNSNGNLGDGTTNLRPNQTQIGTDTAWVYVAAGQDHTLGLKADGSLWAWGNNQWGEVGDGTATQRNAPVKIGTGWSSIAAGNHFSAGVKADGTLWAWGNNQYGQLGQADASTRYVPTQIGSATDWATVELGTGNLLAEKVDGTVYGCGLNAYGQVGDGSAVQRTTLMPINQPGWVPYATSGSFAVSYPSGASNVYVGFKDVAGNTLSLFDDIIFDSAPPVTAASGLVAGWANHAEVVTLTPTDDVSGVQSTSYTVNGGGTQSYGAPITFSTEGTTTFAYRSVDKAGNSEAWNNATIQVDTVGPSTTSDLTTAWRSSPNVSISASDLTSGVFATYYRVNGGAATTVTAGTFAVPQGVNTVQYWSVDKAGNAEATTTISAHVDFTAPTSFVSTLPSDWVSHDVTVTLTATDSVAGQQLSGVSAILYTIDGGATQTYSAPFTIGDGLHALRWWAVDNLGNTEASHNATVKVDTTAPITTTSADGAWHGAPATVSLAPTDAHTSIGATFYSLNGGAATPYLGPFPVVAEGITTVTYWSVDVMGNAESPHTVPVKLDYTKPISTLSGVPAETMDSAVTLTLAVDDGTGSGATEYYSLNGGPTHPYTADQVALPIADEGTTTISYWGVDAVGNTESPRSATFKIAYADYTTNGMRNPTCIGCHSAPNGPRQVRLDFAVAPVDRASACPACHVSSLAGTHPYHNTAANCGAICHLGWGGGALQTAIPSARTPYGAFASASSKDLTADQLHLIHSVARWPAGVDFPDSRCASCHAAAACDACHVNGGTPIADTHSLHSATGNHAYPSQAPVSRTVGYGVPAGNQAVLSVTPETKQCGTAGCHNTAGLRSNDPVFYESFSHAASPTAGAGDNTALVKTGTWRTSYNAAYTSGQMCYSSTVGGTFAVTVSGIKASLISETGPARGMADILVDGAWVATVDCFSPTTVTQATVWTSGSLVPGTHTITVKVLGSKNAASTGTSIVVDRFYAWQSLADKVAPLCTSCHPDRAADHGYGDVSHVANQTDTVEPLSGATCSSCHSMDLLTEHERVGSSSAGKSCANCHASPRRTFGTWNHTCAQGGCHTPGSVEAAHAGLPARHTPSAAETTCLRNCHSTNLGTEHAKTAHTHTVTCVQCHNSPEFNALRAGGWNGTCAACHTQSHATSAESGNQLCFDCHGTTDTTMTAIAGASAYGATGGDHQTGYGASAHSSATVPAGNIGGVQSGIQCEACHNKSATSSAEYLDLRTSGGAAAASAQSALCVRCHSASGDETTSPGPKPHTWNGRDIATEFARPSHHPVVGTSGLTSSGTTGLTLMAQSTDADFNTDTTFQMATPITGGAKLLSGAHTETPAARSLMFFAPGWGSAFDQYDPATNSWDSMGFDPPEPAATAGFTGYTGVVTSNTLIFTPGQGNTARYRYTPPNGTGVGTWTSVSSVPFGMSVGGEACLDQAHGKVYYFGGWSSSNMSTWNISSDTWSSTGSARDASGTDLAVGHGAGEAYSPETDRLFVVRAAQYSAVGGSNGHLYYLASPSTAGANPHFVDTGVQVTTPGPYDPTQTWGRMIRITRGGHDYLMYAGMRPDGTYSIQVIGNLGSATPTVRDLGLFPWGAGNVYGLSWGWNGTDTLYLAGYDWNSNFSHITVPADPLNGTWPAAWTTMSAAPNFDAGGMMSFLNATPAPYAATGFYSLGTISADVGRPASATSWGTLTWDAEQPTSSGVSLAVQGWDGSSWSAVAGFGALTSGPVDLSAIPIGTYSKLRITASLWTVDPAVTPTLRSWSLTGSTSGDEGTASLSCASCHNPHGVQTGGVSAWDPSRVSDPANTKTLWASKSDPSMTAFCLTCHTTTTIRQGTSALSIQPFDIGFRNLGVGGTLFPGWSKSGGTASFLKSGHYTTTGAKALCENCHDPHGSQNAHLLAWTRPSSWTTGVAGTRDNTSTAAFEQNLCLQCHGNGTSGRQAPGAQDVASALASTYKHDQSPAGAHSDTETVASLSANRHAECVDCHDPHAAQPGTHVQGTSVGPALMGATGVTPTWDGTQFSAATALTPMRITGLATDAEANVCFKCHSSAQRTVTRPDSSTYTATDLTKEFNPSNASYHNVLGLAVGMRSTFTIGGTTFTWNPPAESTMFVSGWHYNSKVSCSDCHTGGAVGQAKGPHGSSVQYMLDPAYPDDWKSASLDWSLSGGVYGNAQIICVKCHNLTGNTNSVHNAWEFGSRAHGNTAYPCTTCHVAIPHGWKRPRLLVTAADPYPYAQLPPYGRYINAISMRSHDSQSWSSADCNSSCYNHSGGAANPMP